MFITAFNAKLSSRIKNVVCFLMENETRERLMRFTYKKRIFIAFSTVAFSLFLPIFVHVLWMSSYPFCYSTKFILINFFGNIWYLSLSIHRLIMSNRAFLVQMILKNVNVFNSKFLNFAQHLSTIPAFIRVPKPSLDKSSTVLPFLPFSFSFLHSSFFYIDCSKRWTQRRHFSSIVYILYMCVLCVGKA